jgi:flagellar motor switch protein FliN/FliY
MLSQDEINALLSGMDLSAGGGTDGSGPGISSGGELLLTDMEKDAIGEVANISMGSSATNLYALVNQVVDITTPQVSMSNWDDLLSEYAKPCVLIQIKYTQGLDGSNLLVLKEDDVKIITDLMMGGDGTNIGGELGELQMSAIAEAMNQMMGAAATSLSTMLGMKIDISPPTVKHLGYDEMQHIHAEDVEPFLGSSFVRITFNMTIGDLINSSIMQLYPLDFSRKIVDTFISVQMGGIAASSQETAGTGSPGGAGQAGGPMGNAMGMNQMGMDPAGMNQMGMNPMGMNPMGNAMGGAAAWNPAMNFQSANVNIQPAQFQNFSSDYHAIPGQENIGLIRDVPLEVTVELGRTTKSISDILEFSPGTIIELNRIAGEPIDVLVNGKFVAKGEVVVIEESFGVRVTEIIK